MKRNAVPPRYQGVWDKAAAGHCREAACRLHCLECTAFVASDVRRCLETDCCHYPYRLSPRQRQLQREREAKKGAKTANNISLESTQRDDCAPN
jgi:hypothetical protein